MTAAFAYDGPPDHRAPVLAALTRVVDPELSLSIVDLGLVHAVCVDGALARVRMTMTSAACPVADLIVEDVEHELARVLPAGCAVQVELVWEPPWSPASMSERAKRVMGW